MTARATEDSHQTKGLLRLTMACNERCPFCNVPVEDYPRPTPSSAEIDAQLAAFVASGERTLTISGGEPTLLRRRLLALIRAARAAGVPFVELQTNATLIDPPYAAALAEAGLTSAFVSLLSDAPELHDLLAGLEGAWPRCLGGIDALLAQGIAVTLNPVLARATQARLVDYIDFVALRLPGVRAISLSAVQPHGRAAHGIDALMPDYAVLGPQVERARARARQHGLALLNPYCGLPLCVGWSDDLEHCVEAIEARMGGWQERPGIENQGDKSHGPACRSCALRPWCGGAWHAYWETRAGSGLQPPREVIAPWRAGAAEHPLQTLVKAPGGPTAETWRQLQAAPTPTVWLWTDQLSVADVALLLQTRCSHVGLEVQPHGLARGGAAARALAGPLRRLQRAAGGRLGLRLAVRGTAGQADLQALKALAAALGAEGVDMLPGAGQV